MFLGTHEFFTTGLIRFALPPSSTGRYPFYALDDLGGILGFTGDPAFRNLRTLQIFGCMYDNADATSCDLFSNQQIAFDNVLVQSTVAAVPEPPTYAMFGAGLLGLSLALRRKRSAASAARLAR